MSRYKVVQQLNEKNYAVDREWPEEICQLLERDTVQTSLPVTSLTS